MYTSMNLPIAVWMMRSFLAEVPVEMLEAAQIDGAGLLLTLRTIIAPVAMPGIAATALICFIFSWNELLLARVLTGVVAGTAPVFLTGFVSSQGLFLAKVCAAAVVISLPVLVRRLRRPGQTRPGPLTRRRQIAGHPHLRFAEDYFDDNINRTVPHPSRQPDVPATMRAAVLKRQGDMAMETLPVPQLEADQVLVQVAAVGVCGSDVHYYEHGRIGDYVVDHPLILGHELSGRIAAVGSAVDPARIGKRVAVEPQRPCRTCKQCKAGRYNLCPDIEFYATPPIDGAFAEYVTIQSDFAYDIPDSVSDEAAALIEPLSVGLWACERAEIKPGSRVLIAGAGPIGIIAAQAARAFGATEIYITDIAEDRLAFALEHGATHALNAKTDTVEGLDVDAFIDASGAPQAVRSGIKAVGPAGRVILVGLGADDVELPVSYIQNREIWLSGVFRYTNTWPLAIQLIADGKVDLDILVTGKFALAESEEALKAGKQPGQLKAVVYPGRCNVTGAMPSSAPPAAGTASCGHRRIPRRHHQRPLRAAGIRTLPGGSPLNVAVGAARLDLQRIS